MPELLPKRKEREGVTIEVPITSGIVDVPPVIDKLEKKILKKRVRRLYYLIWVLLGIIMVLLTMMIIAKI